MDGLRSHAWKSHAWRGLNRNCGHCGVIAYDERKRQQLTRLLVVLLAIVLLASNLIDIIAP
jgi:predicted nucleic acid-binding Zn ribbon protein